MPSNTIKCILCGVRKPLNEFSKRARKCQESSCKRCVAWTETQEPGVIPAPLETGHVSVEEFAHNYWGDEFRTAEDFEEHTYHYQEAEEARKSSSSALAKDDTHSKAATETASETAIASLPAHLQRRARRIASTQPSDVETATAAALTSLPPHLRPKEEEKKKRRSEGLSRDSESTHQDGEPKEVVRKKQWFNAYGPDDQADRVRAKAKAMTVAAPLEASAVAVSNRPGSLPFSPEDAVAAGNGRTGTWPLKLDSWSVPNLTFKRVIEEEDHGATTGQRPLGFCASDESE
ncbi:hypothetical protein GMORB2_7567 [Geosmithia morbida]|uniref:Stc1 domain-containing protein n=1 Tax=Geosmithia morbida TaxID=1094350 RepID=A0A9P4YUE6_9HYPO|nr:uncharacterized protein GMORB2_7567 [Geosmithia morbida]KAF4121974.1 hypothetical protein GMORB2_7567 [Geosmithia morbida]